MSDGRKPSEIIRETKNVLFERGWHQGAFESPDGRVCLVGAFTAAVSGNALDLLGCTSAERSAWWRTGRIIEAAIDVRGTTVPKWNDTPGRTFDQVIDTLDRAEKLALIREERA